MATKFDQLPARIREIRAEKFGLGGGGVANAAQALGIPDRTWAHIEDGVSAPAWVLLQFLVLTGAEPRWLLTGEGERDRAHAPSQGSHRGTAQ
jgi:hypothetical protein